MATIQELKKKVAGAKNNKVKEIFQRKLDEAMQNAKAENDEAMQNTESLPSVKKPKATRKRGKNKPKAPKTAENISDAKKSIKDKTGKTEAECEDIISQYKSLRSKTQARKQKETDSNKKQKVKIKKEEAQGTRVGGKKTPATKVREVANDIEKDIETQIDNREKQIASKVP
jgi:hypothetical protein